jgi:hypothetical protein
MNLAERDAETLQREIYRRMTPTERLQQAVRMNRQMRSLMDAGLKAAHPDWPAEQRQREVARRILHARTG